MEKVKKLLEEFGLKEVKSQGTESTEFIYSDKIKAVVKKSGIELIFETNGQECLWHTEINHTGLYTDENLSTLESQLVGVLNLKKDPIKSASVNASVDRQNTPK